MGQSMHIGGIKSHIKTGQMFEVYEACTNAGISVPDEVTEFFNDEVPNPNGIEVGIPYRDIEEAFTEGYEVELAKLDKDVTHIRFTISY